MISRVGDRALLFSRFAAVAINAQSETTTSRLFVIALAPKDASGHQFLF